MKTQPCRRRLEMLLALTLAAASARANPISLPEKSIAPTISLIIGGAILCEVVCIWWRLRRFRRPRFFIFWLLVMHLFTYPAFLALLWQLHDVRPALAVALGEGLVVVIEGALIYLMCRFMPATQPGLPIPSMARCWLASLIGNACSAAVFPGLCKIFA
jgi:hypothetical protein